jgi:hypothetical protein
MTNEFEIERLLFQQVGKPDNYLTIKAINVFGDYYRVNIYTQTEDGTLIKKRIGNNSYFCCVNKEGLRIVNSFFMEQVKNPKKKEF